MAAFLLTMIRKTLEKNEEISEEAVVLTELILWLQRVDLEKKELEENKYSIEDNNGGRIYL